MKNKQPNILSGFILKIVALITMTFDHIGIFILDEKISTIFRSIGRLAFPLFIFLLVEGVRHTKHFGKYFLRISILALIIMIGSIGVTLFIDKSFEFSSPIMDLVFVSLMIYLINRKDKLSFLSIMPALYIVLCFIIEVIEFKTNKPVSFLPYYLRADYNIFGLFLSLGFYFAKPLSKLFFKSKNEIENLVYTPYQRIAENLISVLVIFLATFIYQLIAINYGVQFDVQPYAIFASIPIMFYSGERGYNKKWFQYGSYLYFPLHIVIIYLIFTLI